MRAELIRNKFHIEQTTGVFLLYDDKGKVLFESKTLELDMDGNKEGESCIPVGTYKLIPLIDRPSHTRFRKERYGYFPYLVKGVPNRTGILMHHANFHSDLLGCIAHGDSLKDIDGDGLEDVTNSISTMKSLNEVLKEPVEFEIKNSTIPRKDFPEPYRINVGL